MKMSLITYNLTATLSLFPTENGGRKKPVYNHYRPSFSFNTLNHVSGEVSFPGKGELWPGNTALADIKLLPSKHIRHTLKRGDSFTLLEGDKVIGTGVIEDVKQKQKDLATV